MFYKSYNCGSISDRGCLVCKGNGPSQVPIQLEGEQSGRSSQLNNVHHHHRIVCLATGP